MATLTIPDSAQAYFPDRIDPAQLWVNYNSKVDSLTIYFTGKPVPSVWDDVDEWVKIVLCQSVDAPVGSVTRLEHLRDVGYTLLVDGY